MSEGNNGKTNRVLIEEIHTTVVQLKTVLVGVAGTDDKGLVGEVRENKAYSSTLAEKHRKLSLRVWILISTLVASGIVRAGELANVINVIK